MHLSVNAILSIRSKAKPIWSRREDFSVLSNSRISNICNVVNEEISRLHLSLKSSLIINFNKLVRSVEFGGIELEIVHISLNNFPMIKT